MTVSIDVVIPSFRLNADILKKILDLAAPPDVNLQFIIIADNPKIAVPQEIQTYSKSKPLTILINEKNLGFSATRNRGIDESKSDWILLLDDDIDPDQHLIAKYSEAVKRHPDAIGFVGTTYMPAPFNAVTTALDIYGITGHFTSATREKEMVWAPTANILLNRKKLATRRFNETLKNGGEDIELLSRNAMENGGTYFSVPEAFVVHPWWNNGKSQVKKMFNYGKAATDILRFSHIKRYAFLDFTNTAESLCLLFLLAALQSLLMGTRIDLYLLLIWLIIFSEFLICVIKTTIALKKISLSVSVHLFLHKLAYEIGAVLQTIRTGKITAFSRRVDLSFRKANPSPFRLNRWKIIKMLIILIGLIMGCLLL